MNMILESVLKEPQGEIVQSPFTVDARTPLDGYYVSFSENGVHLFEKGHPFNGHPRQLFHIPIRSDLLREGVQVQIVGFKCDYNTKTSTQIARFEGTATSLREIQTLALQLIQSEVSRSL